MPRQLLALCASLFICRTAFGGEAAKVSKYGDRIEGVSFPSRALASTKEYCVVLPANYDVGRANWPVLYLLHGRGRNDRSLIEIESTRAALLDASFVTVLPNGEDGWYVDSPVNPKSNYERLLEETIKDADARYRTSSKWQQRAIAGWSMGGFGAAHYATAHADEFGTLATIVGLLDFPRTGLPKDQSYPVPPQIFGDKAAAWKTLNPLNAADKLRGTNLVLITADRAFDRTMNENFRDRLKQLDIEHEWIVLPGTHHIDVVKQAVPIVLDRVKRAFDKSAAKESSDHAN